MSSTNYKLIGIDEESDDDDDNKKRKFKLQDFM
jgi:hypothetical protein